MDSETYDKLMSQLKEFSNFLENKNKIKENKSREQSNNKIKEDNKEDEK